MTELTHFDAEGNAHMVDVSGKDTTTRVAIAEGRIFLNPDVLAMIRAGDAKKGDVLGTARLAGIMAAKRTSDLIPLCHPLAIAKVSVYFEIEQASVRIEALVKTTGQTGVEMEALTAASVAALTIYDMIKAAQKDARIDGIRLLEKSGGRSGHFVAP